MKTTSLLVITSLLLLTGCKKEDPDKPVNSEENNQGLDCATCPSVFHPFNDLTIEETETCDNFTDVINYPSDFLLSGGIVGYTQEASQPITLQDGGFLQINESDIEPGFYGANSLVFDFDGTEQEVTFTVYGQEERFNEMGFSINGESTIYYADEFPKTLAGVIVEVDLSTPDIGALEAFEVRFIGQINSITQTLYESGITALCVKKVILPEPPTIDQNASIYFDDFYTYDGTILGSFPTAKTPLGYYGLQATNMAIKFEDFLAYQPTRIGFVHAYTPGKSNLINLQLPSTPLIVTAPDSLEYYLTPYGYSVEHYYKTNAKLWTDLSSEPEINKVLDSIIISGTAINEVTIGTNLNKSELRSVCTYYEQ